MRITIVTPSLNQAAFIEEALWSVKNLNYPALEHIVVDGASTDDTLGILKNNTDSPGWEHLRWVSEPDNGQSDALNKGFRKATGDIVGWLNSDDRYRPGCFAAVVEAFQNDPEVDVLYGDYTWISENGRVWQIRREIEFSRFVLQYHRVLYIPATATFFRRRIFDEGNFIDTQFNYAMDYEFFLRLARKGYLFKHIPHLLADFRWHPQSKTGSAASKQLQEHDRIAQMYSPLLNWVPDGLARKLIFRCLRLAAAGARYTEKMARGYYFQQFRPTSLRNADG
ncbi:MAG: glycosyltransferase [Candidatus Brocadiales bacterium]|nr:glycosyltransferase [Candidatus Bathyanammoxibius sp.]